MLTREQILNTLYFRHACKEFDPNRKITEEDFATILEGGRLSPSSFGFEPWKFAVLQNSEQRKKILPVCWGAQKQLPTASHFLLLLARKGSDMLHSAPYIRTTMSELQKSPPEVIITRLARLKKFQELDFDLNTERTLFDWACLQTYIALANMLTTAAFLNIDSCPIEGFNRPELENILEQESILDRSHFGLACMAAFGYRAAPPKREKIRRPLSEIVTWFK